jgi:hypothetical protein
VALLRTLLTAPFDHVSFEVLVMKKWKNSENKSPGKPAVLRKGQGWQIDKAVTQPCDAPFSSTQSIGMALLRLTRRQLSSGSVISKSIQGC